MTKAPLQTFRTTRSSRVFQLRRRRFGRFLQQVSNPGSGQAMDGLGHRRKTESALPTFVGAKCTNPDVSGQRYKFYSYPTKEPNRFFYPALGLLLPSLRVL